MIYTASVDDLWRDRAKLYIPWKRERLPIFYRSFHEVIQNVHDGYAYDEISASKTEYWNYLKGYHESWQVKPITYRAYKQLRHKFFDGIKLYRSLEAEGMRNPLLFHEKDGVGFLFAGMRRLVILHVLGTESCEVSKP